MIYAVNTGLIVRTQPQELGWPLRSPKSKICDAAARGIAKADAFSSHVESIVSTRCLIEWQLLTLVRPSEVPELGGKRSILMRSFGRFQPTDEG